jgi:hypothetical protein
MPSVTFDGRSFMLDGRRVWLVSGAVHYIRVPRELWADRIHAAKLAGLNTVETPVFWNHHEARPGKFDFKGDHDLRHFVKLIGEAGLHCILRPGPFVGSGVDFGGLPSWLMGQAGVQFRTVNGPFLEACSRYLTAVADQVRDLQVTSTGKGGPIILVQNEAGWTCGHETLGRGYLGEINRYLREAGLTVPTINANNLWQGVEGEIDGWVGDGPMLGTMRQLATVRPDQPRLAVEYRVGQTPVWGVAAGARAHPSVLQRRLAEVLAGAGQYNIDPFFGGTNFAFWGGRLPDVADAYGAATHDPGAPLDESGAPGAAFHYVRRISTFASRFARVLSNLDPTYHPVCVDPDGPECGCSVVHTVGAQGGVAFVFGPDPARTGKAPTGQSASLLLSNGATLTTHLGGQAVAWCLLNVQLAGRATLDYCTLCALGAVGKVLVCFGPAGAEGEVSINGSPITVTVPRGARPLVLDFEGVTLVVCSEEQADTTYLTDSAVYVGVAGVRADGAPAPLPAGGPFTRIESTGEVVTRTLHAELARIKPGSRAALGPWSMAPTEDHARGTSARFASIPGPAELTSLGSPLGYGWYRIVFKGSAPRRTHVAFPQAGDRLHAFLDGEEAGVVGAGPGATGELTLPVKKGPQTLVLLAENLGRAAGGANLGEMKGLYGHVWEVAPIRPGKPIIRPSAPLDILAFRAPLWDVQEGDLTSPDRLTWTIQHRTKTPIFINFTGFPLRALLILNDKPIRFLERGAHETVCLWPEITSKGNNHIQLALIPDVAGPDGSVVDIHARALDLAHHVSFTEGVASLSAKAEWSFAKWEQPPASAFKPTVKGEAPTRPTGRPAWWKCSFVGLDSSGPAILEIAGLTKGQFYVNGKHVGRYFVATADGKAVPPQTRYVIPAPWLHAGKSNDLVIFDEHGGNPSRCRVLYEEGAAPIRA